jgi:hypothetical protein
MARAVSNNPTIIAANDAKGYDDWVIPLPNKKFRAFEGVAIFKLLVGVRSQCERACVRPPVASQYRRERAALVR